MALCSYLCRCLCGGAHRGERKFLGCCLPFFSLTLNSPGRLGYLAREPNHLPVSVFPVLGLKAHTTVHDSPTPAPWFLGINSKSSACCKHFTFSHLSHLPVLLFYLYRVSLYLLINSLGCPGCSGTCNNHLPSAFQMVITGMNHNSELLNTNTNTQFSDIGISTFIFVSTCRPFLYSSMETA